VDALREANSDEGKEFRGEAAQLKEALGEKREIIGRWP
jgi:hypothetical protein